MTKTLKAILETYAPRSDDEKRFIEKHVTVKHSDRAGNGDDVFKAKKIKVVKRSPEHGYDVGKDHEVYEETIAEATVDTKKYSWGTMKTVHHGKSFSIPLHPEHHEPISKLKDGESHDFTDETRARWKATRKGDNIHFSGTMGKTAVPASHLHEEAPETPEDTFLEGYERLHNLKSQIARLQKKHDGIDGIHPEKKAIATKLAKLKKEHGELFNGQFKEDVDQLDEQRGYKSAEIDAAGYKFKSHLGGSEPTTLYHHPELDKHIEIRQERTGISGAKKRHVFYSGKFGSHSGGMQTRHLNLDDAIRKNNGELKEEVLDETYSAPKGTVVHINKPGHRLHGKQARVFYDFGNGSVNAQVTHSSKKGDVSNFTLKPGEWHIKTKIQEASEDLDEARSGGNVPSHMYHKPSYVANPSAMAGDHHTTPERRKAAKAKRWKSVSFQHPDGRWGTKDVYEESVESISELEISTLANYRNKARDRITDHKDERDYWKAHGEDHGVKQANKAIAKRVKGIQRASDRLKEIDDLHREGFEPHPEDDFILESSDNRVKNFVFTHTPGHADSEERLHKLKKMVKAHNAAQDGDSNKLRIIARGRLGKDNPHSEKYRKDGEVWNKRSHGKWGYRDADKKDWGPLRNGERVRGYTEIHMKHAKHHDIYLAPKAFDWKKSSGGHYDWHRDGAKKAATSIASMHKALHESMEPEAIMELSADKLNAYRDAAIEDRYNRFMKEAPPQALTPGGKKVSADWKRKNAGAISKAQKILANRSKGIKTVDSRLRKN